MISQNTLSPTSCEEESSLDKKIKREGIEVGVHARSYFPEGMLIETLDPEEEIIQTKKAIQQGTNILFEAAFRYGYFDPC